MCGVQSQGGESVMVTGCMQCGKALTFNEIGAHKKFVNRGSTEFLCLACLSKKLDVPVARLEEKIEEFKEQGCSLFV